MLIWVYILKMYDQKILKMKALGQSVHAYLFKNEQVEEAPEVELVSNKRFYFMVTVGISLIVVMRGLFA